MPSIKQAWFLSRRPICPVPLPGAAPCRDGNLPVTVFRDGRQIKLEVPIDSDQRWAVRDTRRGFTLLHLRPPGLLRGDEHRCPAACAFRQKGRRREHAQADEFGQSHLLADGRSIRFSRREARDRGLSHVQPQAQQGLRGSYTYPVSQANGTRIRDLKHLVELLRDARGDFVEFTFQGRFTDKIVFDRKRAVAATEEVLNDNGIRQQCSSDMAKVWDISRAN